MRITSEAVPKSPVRQKPDSPPVTPTRIGESMTRPDGVAKVRGEFEYSSDLEFIIGPKRNALEPDELISAFYIEKAVGPQQYAKIGTRNAMVIAVCSLSLDLDPEEEKVSVCVGSAGPTPLRAPEAESFIEGVISEERLWQNKDAIPKSAKQRFGELVAEAAKPIDDVRGTAAYRKHAVGVLAKRTLSDLQYDRCRESLRDAGDAEPIFRTPIAPGLRISDSRPTEPPLITVVDLGHHAGSPAPGHRSLENALYSGAHDTTVFHRDSPLAAFTPVPPLGSPAII